MHKIFLWCSIVLLLSTWNTFLCYINFFFCWHEILFRATSTRFCRNKITFCATSNFLFQHKIIFRATPNFCFGHCLECCHGDIFLWSHSNKNIITCQKINKLSFLCDTKKIISFCLHHHFFIFSFYITHCQHVDLLRSGPGNKETFNPSFTHLSDIPKQLLSKSCSRKLVSVSRFNVWKTSERSSYFSKVAGSFLTNFAKINTVTGIYKNFTEILSNFLSYAIFPEDFPTTVSVNFKISFQ